MAHMTYTEPAAKALTELIHQLRPAWDRRGILAAIHQATAKRDLILVAHIAIDATQDRTARTPAVIATRDRTAIEPTTPSQADGPWDRHACPTCKRIHTPDQTTCKRAGPDITARGAATARKALTEATGGGQ